MIGIQRTSLTVAAILAVFIISQISNAQDSSATAKRKPDLENQELGLPKALKRLEANYPEEAKALRISGIVVVEFVVDQDGKVISTRAMSGHPILKPAAVEAAKGWEFEIPMHKEQPTKMLGSMTFCFLTGKDISKSRYTFAFEKCCPGRVVRNWCTESK